MSAAFESKNARIARWILKLAVVGIFTAVGWLPKLTGQAGALAEKLDAFGGATAVTGIAVMELVIIVLVLIPRTALIGSALAVGAMLGAIGSHLGPVGFEGDFFGVFIMAIVGLLVAAGAAVMEHRAGIAIGAGGAMDSGGLTD